ncbi:hypothetical protein HDA32_005815 [Spinactinospora alkalitolerans]|uniref:Uncharacterized protein n=1 Tax=Spinactinospora alkalitolerans TaxID=687207 RepID=A0A852U562_9ACTN|nr:hypothetical protein [Spinactinospora alkalitolerans]NYE50695.1 hypothetical protein [Spinactinospora alkalitolerans]
MQATFHSGGLFEDEGRPASVGNPRACCFRYPERTPILTVSQGRCTRS